MLFNSFTFFLFFPIVTVVYFLLNHKYRWIWLLLASIYFYMSFVPIYILILFFTIIIDYIAGLAIERQSNPSRRKLFLIVSIIANIGVLSFFKYANFFIDNVNVLSSVLHWNYSVQLLKIILPIGLSFHTFQSLSYTIEVYRGNQKAEKNIGVFALYVLFYPQLVAGPIERPQNLLHQFREIHNVNYERITSGLRLMAWGFFKKVVIADHLAEFVNPVYGNVHLYHGWPLITATILFAFQIYYDFSGYTDIARGAARVMGFELMVNFKNPYFAKSIPEFWQRWHISLSSWFRDYVYIPLGGNRVNKWRHYLNFFIVFVLSGLWHGAKWTYVIWGGLNGIYIIFSYLSKQTRDKLRFYRLPPALNNIRLHTTNFFLICLAWIFFRANSLDDAWYIIKNLVTGTNMLRGLLNPTYLNTQLLIGRGLFNFLTIFIPIVLVETVSILAEKRNQQVEDTLRDKKWYVRWITYYLVMFTIIALGLTGATSFIYFQF